MPKNYILSIDQGTTGSTALLIEIDKQKEISILNKSTVDFPQHYPKTGWVEHDLDEVWDSVQSAIKNVLEKTQKNHANFKVNDIHAIGITNQRETTCVIDRTTGKPLSKAIVWQCKRSTDICKKLKEDGYEGLYKKETGLVLDPYFSGSKIAWLLKNNADVSKAVENKTAYIGTIDAWLLYKLTGGKEFATEPSNASRTLLYNINTGKWDQKLLDPLGIPHTDMLPELKDSAGLFGKTSNLGFLPDGISISGILGDQQAALAGQACFEVGEGKCTYGTGAFLLVNQGHKVIHSYSGLLTTVAWSINGKLTYAFEGSAFIAGAAIQFERDQLGLLQHASQSENMAADCHAAPDLYFVPSLSGLGAPYWNPNAKGAFLGLTRGTTKNQLVRAALEGICFQVNDLIYAMEKDLNNKINVLRVDGGAVANNILMQNQADFLQINIERPKNLETTALGAAFMAALGAGIYKTLDEIKNAQVVEKVFRNDSSKNTAKEIKLKLAGWKKAVKAVEVFSSDV